MNSATSIYQHLKQKISRKFLLVFSFCSLSVGGIVWACADYGYDYQYSSFSPEAFVSPEYTPFFYAEYISYYGGGYDSPYDKNTERYNDQVVSDWYSYFDKKVDSGILNHLLLKASAAGIDSAYQSNSLKADKKKLKAFFDYLSLAKSAEKFAATDVMYSWEPQPAVKPPVEFEASLVKSFKKSKDAFIKQRLWFQLVRYYYFSEKSDSTLLPEASKTLKTFEASKNSFPQNMMHYRTLGYVAGWHYQHKNYAVSNYLNSLCYNYSVEAKIPSEWSFHPQEEADWNKTLTLAKTNEERATLWHMLGINYDPLRAIGQIEALDPKSDKLDLLLARIINITEYHISGGNGLSSLDSAEKRELKQNTTAISNIALKNNTAKPYFWNLAAGYLNYLSHNYTAAKTFYQAAKPQLPPGDKLVMAQYQILDWVLYVKELKKIDPEVEAKMVAPLNWFADLKTGKDTISSLRFAYALDSSLHQIAGIYKKQGELVKANALENYTDFYIQNNNIEQMKTLLQKPNKTAFEKTMLRYYPFDLQDLYYHQAQVLAYQDKIDEAIAMMTKSESEGDKMLANPFTMRINDCHDCDHQRKQSKEIYSMDVLKTIQLMKSQIKKGTNVYENAILIANAFYNMSFYGNSRIFYSGEVMQSGGNTPFEIPIAFRSMLLSNKIAEKYYLIALRAAKTNEQKARCTFMASKCEKNESYNLVYTKPENSNGNEWTVTIEPVFYGAYFSILNNEYDNTKFYQEIIKECGYFKSYVNEH
ncbi:hypothetical protein [Pedobacter sp. MC2016-24]|uniref:hypothetical protein n=1 Tax=Pedobacter sp. MC2016-24 TaxID=2780090 RepID=UPI00187E63CE|nr:hypothetical protein [Pedobacter sp. MC2016-24]MBE9599301.1 hypothetical protein [Pedobacter sp. MC2016-24]